MPEQKVITDAGTELTRVAEAGLRQQVVPRNLLRERDWGAQEVRDRAGVNADQGRHNTSVRLRHGNLEDQGVQDRQDCGSEPDAEEAVADEHQGTGGLSSGTGDKRRAGAEGVRNQAQASEPIIREECVSCAAWHIEYGCLVWWQFHKRNEEGKCELYNRIEEKP